jgi:tetratricopeptide (TPR) repeat protein
MKSIRGYRQKLSSIRRSMGRAEYVAALGEVDSLLEDWPGAASLHVLRSELIQLQDSNEAPPLEEAKAALKHAAELENPGQSALVEQGYFQFAVEDDAKGALQSFKAAVEVYRDLLIEALVGQAAVLEELRRREEAFDCLSHARLLQTTLNGHAGSSPGHQLMQRWDELSAGGSSR